jgi:hypothetical protein
VPRWSIYVLDTVKTARAIVVSVIALFSAEIAVAQLAPTLAVIGAALVGYAIFSGRPTKMRET